MTEAGMNTIVNAVAWMVVIGLFLNGAIFAANLKLYTEIMKEKSQRGRGEGKKEG